MSNWEDAVSWVWSTCLDCSIDFGGTLYEIPSIGQYNLVDGLAEALYERGKYYVVTGTNDAGNDIYGISNDEFNSEIKYYKLNGIDYNLITLTNNENKVYKTGIYYILQDEKNNIYTISNDRFNPNESYY